MFEIHTLEANLCYVAMTHLCKPKNHKKHLKADVSFFGYLRPECYRGSQAGHSVMNEFTVVNNGSSSIL